MTGTASLEAAGGSILGVNLEEALRRSRRRPINVDRDMRLGGSAFDKLDLSLALNNGRAEIQRGVMISHGVTAEIDGAIDLVAQNWALQFNAAQTDAAGQKSQDGAHVKLDVNGPWSAPTIRAIGENDASQPIGDPAPSH